MLELDQELILELECPVCNTLEPVLKPISEISFEAAHCPTCETFRETRMTHTIQGDEDFTHRTLASLGIPPLHILRAHNLEEYRFYELTGDLPEALHFSHFEETDAHPKVKLRKRIRIGDEVPLDDETRQTTRGRIKIFD